MIEGPLTGATDSSDAASAADVSALAVTVATNTSAISTKADGTALATAESTISTHTEEIVGLTTSFSNLGNSFYTKALTDALLSSKQATIGDGDLTIARTASLQAVLDVKAIGSDMTTAQGTLSTHNGAIASLTSSITTLAIGKQDSLSNNGGGGIPLLNGTDVRQVTAVAPLSATICYDFANPSDVNNHNVELSVDLSGKQDTIQCVAASNLTTFTTPVTCQYDLTCADLTDGQLDSWWASLQINSAISSAFSAAIAGKQDNTYGAVINATAYATKTGSWLEDSTSSYWRSDLHFNGVGVVESYGAGVGANTARTETITYDIPSAYQGGSVFINTLPWSTGGCVDVYMTRNNNTADEISVTRLNAFQNARNFNNGGNHDGVGVDLIATGYASYPQIIIKVRKGGFRIQGLAFTKEIDRPVAPLSFVHSDSVCGDPASRSDSRLKDNQQIVSRDTLTSIFDAIETKEYDFRPPGADVDGQPLTGERRVGFVADDVKAALPQSGATSSAASTWLVILT